MPRALEPLRPSRYLDVSAVLCRLQRWEECAVTLFETLAIAPDDRDATERVVQVYRTFDARGTAIADDGHGGVRLNGDDALVHGHRCRAARELDAILRQAGQLGTAARARSLETRWCGTS